MILDLLKKYKNIVFCLYLLIFSIIIFLSKFDLEYFFLFISGILVCGFLLYIYCKYIVKSEFSLNFEIIIIISNVIILFDFIKIMIDFNKYKSASEILMIVIPFSMCSIFFAAKFKINGKLFK